MGTTQDGDGSGSSGPTGDYAWDCGRLAAPGWQRLGWQLTAPWTVPLSLARHLTEDGNENLINHPSLTDELIKERIVFSMDWIKTTH